MSNLSKTQLDALKEKMPTNYVKKIRAKYVELHKDSTSDSSVYAFFQGKTYTTEMHEAVMAVAKMQHDLITATESFIQE